MESSGSPKPLWPAWHSSVQAQHEVALQACGIGYFPALCVKGSRSLFPGNEKHKLIAWRGGTLPVSPAAGTLLALLLSQSDHSKYLNSQHSDGKSSCQVHVRLKGVQDHGVAALGKTKHGETHLSTHCVVLTGEPSLGHEVLSDPGTTSTVLSHHLTQPRHRRQREVMGQCWGGEVLL